MASVRRIAVVLGVAPSTTLVAAFSGDDAGDREALTALGMATNYKGWAALDHWLDDSTSVCKWKGVSCTNNRVTKLSLPDNGLRGDLPAELAKLSELETLKLNSERPDDYHGCGINDFSNASMAPLYGLKKLKSLNLEYTCLGGTLDGIEAMESLESLQIHGNYISGPIPAAMGTLANLRILKLGRNPISGTVPAFTTLPKLETFNCNFCALTGQFPDIFEHMPLLSQSFWDGNAFTGSLPPSLGKAKSLAKLSFNINGLTGAIPAGICDIPAAQDGGECRIGADTDLEPYQADYPWILPVAGNLYDCEGGLPACAEEGGRCNLVKKNSPVHCRSAAASSTFI